MSAAARQKRRRERARQGLRVYRIAAQHESLSEFLIDHELLAEWDAEDADAISQALEKYLAALLADHL